MIVLKITAQIFITIGPNQELFEGHEIGLYLNKSTLITLTDKNFHKNVKKCLQ